MPDSAVTVKFTADVTDLQAKSAIAKAELTADGAAVRALAKEYVAASEETKSAVASQLQSAVAAYQAQKTELESLQAEIAKAAVETEAATGIFAKFTEGLEGATEKVEGLTERLSGITKFTAAVGELALAGLGVEQVAESINHVAETGESLLKLSEETGLTTEQLSGLRVMATETGTDFDSFTKLINKLPSVMQEAAINPSSKAAEAFHAMGVSITDLSTGQLLPVATVLDEVSAKLASYTDSTNKTALETDIFGNKIGADLIPMLNQLGQVGIDGAIVKSDQLNQTWTTESAEAAEQYESDMGRAKLAVEGIADSLVQKLLPALDAVENAMAPSLDNKIAEVQTQIAVAQDNRGRFSSAAELGSLKDQLADLQAQKTQLDNSISAQSASSGGTGAGTVNAPNLIGGATREQHQGVGGPDIADDGDNTYDYSSGDAGGGGESAAKKAQEQITQIAADAAEARKEISASEYQAQVDNWNTEVAQGKLSKAAEIQDEIQAQDQMFQAAVAEMQKEAALDADGTAAKAKALDDIQVLTAQHNAELAKLNSDLVSQQIADAKTLTDEQTKAAEATQAAWQKAFAPISQAFDSSINGVLQGTQTLQSAELNAAQSISLAYIDAAAKKVISFVGSEALILAQGAATQLGLTSATAAGTAARLAVQTSGIQTGKSIEAASNAAEINNAAATAAGKAYAAVVGIPLIGPELAPVAAATAYAGVMAFDVLSAAGGMAVPAGVNPLTQLHENEMVLPSYIAQPLTAALGDGALGGGGPSIGDTAMNFYQTNHGVGGDAAAGMASAGKAWMGQILDLSRNGTLRLPGR